MNFAIHYLTEYLYDAPVSDNLNALRVRPATTATQRCDEFNVRVDPDTRLGRHVDYFGTEVIEFGVTRPHTRLTIDVRARVVTSPPQDPRDDSSWEALYSTAYRDAGGEFVLPTVAEAIGPSQPIAETLDELAVLVRATTPLASARLLCQLIPDRFQYQRGVTYVGSTVADLLAAGAGVCQDFVHLALVILRRLGIATRYVSGYLFATDANGSADSIEVDTHAWLEALFPGLGPRGEPVWVGLDPTNRSLSNERYVKIGHGRHYSDIPPIKGVFRGVAESNLQASVQMHRLDPATSARA